MVTAALTALKSTNNDLGIVILWLNCEGATDGSGIEPFSAINPTGRSRTNQTGTFAGLGNAFPISPHGGVVLLPG